MEKYLGFNASTRRRINFQEIYVRWSRIGSYVWIDDNQDLLQQITEFYPELVRMKVNI